VLPPDFPLLRYDGASTTLGTLAAGHATAVQIMFTACTTTCPIQAAIFQRVQRLLPAMESSGIQLLSLSVNPGADTPKALAEWRNRFHAGPTWIAAAPTIADQPRLQTFFGKGSGNFADHSTQVSILDRQGRLVWRTVELPTAEEIAAVLRNVALAATEGPGGGARSQAVFGRG
jgi:protein SCO1/2